MELFKKSPLIPPYIILIAPFFLWGTAMVAMKGVIPDTTPLFMAGIRILPAGFLILAVAAIWRKPQPSSLRGWWWILLFALVDGAMFQGFLAQGLVRTGAGLGSVMIDSQPIAVALLSSILFGEVIGTWGWLGLIVGIGGISLIGLPPEAWESSFTWSTLFDNGEWWMLLASLSMAVGTVLVPYVSRHVDAVIATGWHLVIGGGLLFALSGVYEQPSWGNIDLNGWMALTYAAVFGSAIAYGLFFYLASKGNLTSLSSLTFLTPVFALSFSSLFLGETLSKIQWLGVALTLVSIYLINQRENLKQMANNISITPEPSLVQKPVTLEVPQIVKSD